MLTSIAPLQEITAGIMTGVAKPDVIISAQASSHHFALRPSHMRRLHQADLVIWIDRHFESGFNRLPEILPGSTQALEILPLLEVNPPDGHIWYSPRLILKTIELILAELVKLDPENRVLYRQNADRLSAGVRDLRQRIELQLASTTPAFITDHEFLNHFARDFKLPPVVAAHDRHDGHSGLSHLGEIETYLRQNRVYCLLSAEPVPSKLAEGLARKYQLRSINITPEIDTIENADGILRRLEQLTNALDDCRASS